MIWKWKAIDEFGSVHQGIEEEERKGLLISRLRKQNLYPVRIRHYLWGTILLKLKGWTADIFWVQTGQKIGTLLEAGIPLPTILEILIEKETRTLVKLQWKKVFHHVQAGNDFSSSISRFEPAPGPFLQAMIKAGEASGTLAECLLDGANQIEETYYLKQKIRTALFYPVLLFGIAIIVIYTLSLVVLPMYKTLFEGLDADLPFLTTMLFTFGSYIPYLLVALILGLVAMMLMNKQLGIRVMFPGTRQITRLRELVQFCGLFERLLTAGYPLMDALCILEEIAKGPELSKLIQDLKFTVNEGKRISPVFFVHPIFPAEAAKMLSIGEESGRLSEMLNHLAKMFQRELQQKIARFSRLLEPLLVTGLAGLVGIVAVGVLLPIFEMGMYIR